VAGAGPAGCATAIALARLGVDDVCLLDAPPVPKGPRLGETIPPAARPVLNELGIWDRFSEQRHEPCLGSCSAWGGEELGYNDFLFNPNGEGWHLDRKRFETLLLNEAVCWGTARISVGSLQTIEADANGDFALAVTRSDGTACPIVARHIVDATGNRSALARRVGARHLMHDRLTFIYGFFDALAAAPDFRLTLVEPEELGWWYAASLPDRTLAVAFASDPDIVREHGFARRPKWMFRLLQQRHLATRVDGFSLRRGDLTVRVAPSLRLDRFAGAGWLTVGDAAATCDPISSQGIMNALQDGLSAAETIAGSLATGQDETGAYVNYLTARFSEYLVNRNYFYALEKRWPRSPFWRRRVDRTLEAGGSPPSRL
jgi:flavin-dependent dehydrogenase